MDKTCLDRVSANSEKGRGSEWAVRVGQRLQSRFGQSGAAREMNLVQIVVEASAIRGGLPNTQPTQPATLKSKDTQFAAVKLPKGQIEVTWCFLGATPCLSRHGSVEKIPSTKKNKHILN